MSDADTIRALQRVVAEQEVELLALRAQVAVLTATVAAEREACAKVADTQASYEAQVGLDCSAYAGARARTIAAAIRARGGQ